MSAAYFRTEVNTFRKLLGNGLTYRVPPFQRDYSWTEEEWEDLWSDLLGTFGEGAEPAHYMGYLVLQSSDDKVFDVIDGQQRLTTLSILVLAVLKSLQRLVDAKIEPEQNAQRLQQIRASYIGFVDPVTLVPKPKLTLNRNNNGYWHDFLVPLQSLPTSGVRASELQLRKAFEWFDKKVQSLPLPDGKRGMELARFLEHTSDKLFFTVVTVTDELNAYRVFETLNARGVRLSATDLLKNWLFSLLARPSQSEHELARLQDRWEGIVGRLAAESFPEFLRVHWNSRHAFAREANLFKVIRAGVRDRDAVFTLLRELEEDLDHYLALQSPEQSMLGREAKEQVQLLQLFRVSRPHPMLLAARRRFEEHQFLEILRACVVVSLRYNVICGYSTGEQERTYNASAVAISEGRLTTVAEVVASLRAVYPQDASFQSAFADKSMRTTLDRNKKVVRYLLATLERHENPKSHADSDSDAITIEHVLPQNPGAEWGQLTEASAEALVYRLGNMTLLSRKANSNVGNAGWPAKREVLRQSEFAISRRIAEENDSWGADRIARRQVWMAKQAAAIWHVASLSDR